MLTRYQGIYPIDIDEISTSHLQTCRDFITRFQRILNHQMKILLKLVFRFEKQIVEEKEILKILNSSDTSISNSANSEKQTTKRFSQNLDAK